MRINEFIHLALPFCFIVGIASNGFAGNAPAQGSTVRITAERTSLRDKPAADGAVVAALVKGDELDVLEMTGMWYHVRVRTTGKEGYVHSLLVERTSAAGTTNPVVGGNRADIPSPPARYVEPESAHGIGVGIKGGINLSTVAGPSVTTAKQIVGVTGGPFVSGSFSRIVGFQVEALFSQKGAKYVSGVDQWKLRLTYLDLPILIRIGSLGDSGALGAHVFAGPTMSLKLGSSATYNGVNDTSFKNSDITGSDLGVTVGAGGSFGRIVVDARYTLGLRTLDATSTSAENVKNRTFTVMAGFRFR